MFRTLQHRGGTRGRGAKERQQPEADEEGNTQAAAEGIVICALALTCKRQFQEQLSH